MTLPAANVVDASRIGLELAGQLEEQAWYLLDIGSTSDLSIARELADALEGGSLLHVTLAPAGARALVAPHPMADLGAVLICVSRTDPPGSWDDDAFVELDRLRSRVRERWPRLVWLADAEGIRRMVHCAPHFHAFFELAGRWSDGTMSPAEVDRHLDQLRRRYGTTDDEVLERAKRGELPQDADHHAWLILLGRADLISMTAERDE